MCSHRWVQMSMLAPYQCVAFCVECGDNLPFQTTPSQDDERESITFRRPPDFDDWIGTFARINSCAEVMGYA